MAQYSDPGCPDRSTQSPPALGRAALPTPADPTTAPSSPRAPWSTSCPS